MSIIDLPKAKLLTEIPERRYRLESGMQMRPKPNDIVFYDQSYEDEKGRPMGLVICLNDDGSRRYEAEIYDSEAELL